MRKVSKDGVLRVNPFGALGKRLLFRSRRIIPATKHVVFAKFYTSQ